MRHGGLLEKNGFSNISGTEKTGDHGIDILARLNGVTYAIQCKRYSGNIGNRAVQEAFSGKAYYNADVAVVMTNSYFTQQAQDDAARIGVKLWNRDYIFQVFNLGQFF